MNKPAEKPTGLALLRIPFEAHQISKLPKPYKKDSPKGQCKECGGYHGLPALHLDYVGHAALTDRLLDADPSWNWEPVAFGPEGIPVLDSNGGMWIRLTVCGVTRLGYGDAQGKEGGNAVKERIGDALRNAAMRFGAALDLWHKGDLHLDEEERPTKAAKKPLETASNVHAAPEYPRVTDKQVSVIRDLLAALEASEKEFCESGKFGTLEDLPLAKFEFYQNYLNKKLHPAAAA